MPLTSLPDPRQTFYFRSYYGAEALHRAHKKVAEHYPGQPIVTTIDGDFRGKDSFSLRCVDLEAALDEGVPAKHALAFVDTWNPIKRRDLYPDDLIPSKTIEYDPEGDRWSFDNLIKGDKSDSLTVKAAKRAKHQLEKHGEPENGRVKLSDAFLHSLGPLEQVNISAPLPADKKKKKPEVHSAQNIWHYLKPEQQEQFARNLQETQAEGSYLVVGATEAETDMHHLPDLLHRHGYRLDEEENLRFKRQQVDNPFILSEKPCLLHTPVEPYVYQKVER